MPYIKQELRDVLLATMHPTNAGELNYVLTVVCQSYFHNNGGKYQQINDIVGALEGAKLEFYRRVAAPYEQKKIIENGDVF